MSVIGPAFESKGGRFTVTEEKEALDVYVSRLFFFQDQVKLFHWNTESYGKHKSLDDLYVHLIEATDKFVEMYAGIYNQHPLSVTRSELSPKLTDAKLTTFLDAMRREVGGWHKEGPVSGTALEGVLQDLEGHIATAVYLCAMKV